METRVSSLSSLDQLLEYRVGKERLELEAKRLELERDALRREGESLMGSPINYR